MHRAAQAYGNVANKVATPRELEANLLLKAASQLQAIYDAWDSKKAELETALLFNRKLWLVFTTSMTEGESALPNAIRQNVANLGIFVLKQTMGLMTDPKRDELKSLVNINRQLAQGLLGR
jgi:flagellar protein FlaF